MYNSIFEYYDEFNPLFEGNSKYKAKPSREEQLLDKELEHIGKQIKMLDNDMYTTLKFLLKYQKTYYTLYYSKNYIFYEEPKRKKNKKEILTEILKVL